MMSENKTEDYIRCDSPNKTYQFFSDAEIKAIKAEAYAEGQKAERERCRRIADEFCKEVDPQDGSYIRHWPVTGDRIAAAIMEDKSDE